MAPNNALVTWGNDKTMNLNTLILTNIQSSPYFKVQLFELKTFHEVVDEIYYRVEHLEPWEKGSRKTAGQTGMCGGVRGVGAGGIVSSAYCLLFKLFTLKLTKKQVNNLITHGDSPYIRGLGFMYIRYTQAPSDLWDWYEMYLDDEEELDVKAGGGHVMTIGEMLRQWLVKLEWYSTLFPRIPVPIQKDIDLKLRSRPVTGGYHGYGEEVTEEQEPEHIPDDQVSFGEAERAAMSQRGRGGVGGAGYNRDDYKNGSSRRSPYRRYSPPKRRSPLRRPNSPRRSPYSKSSDDFTRELEKERERQRREKEKDHKHSKHSKHRSRSREHKRSRSQEKKHSHSRELKDRSSSSSHLKERETPSHRRVRDVSPRHKDISPRHKETPPRHRDKEISPPHRSKDISPLYRDRETSASPRDLSPSHRDKEPTPARHRDRESSPSQKRDREVSPHKRESLSHHHSKHRKDEKKHKHKDKERRH
ncbi:unnamed protein product [Lymnaea stagnalis]|uniref:Pre-mRNA-splicing factor 38 n=1 Tax=Lymnaea stagnalis TaxID=6523 RepID=A0AAV2HXW7_LYMST